MEVCSDASEYSGIFVLNPEVNPGYDPLLEVYPFAAGTPARFAA
jgi:hypothetical protein